jgi:hypothetical protein
MPSFWKRLGYHSRGKWAALDAIGKKKQTRSTKRHEMDHLNFAVLPAGDPVGPHSASQ